MPTKTKKEDLPGTIKRSPAKAQRTYAETLDSAHEQYEGDEARAHQTAFAAVKHSFELEGHTKDELMARARKLGISGRSKMTKLELGQAIARKQD